MMATGKIDKKVIRDAHKFQHSRSLVLADLSFFSALIPPQWHNLQPIT